MQSNLSKSTVKVETRFNSSLPSVIGDANELQQVFLNIIVNAGKVMPDGGDLTVVTSTRTAEDMVCVSISDTGTGIEPDIIDKIFDPFFTTGKPGEGTGLGLSISYGIVRDHNGRILVDSRPGEGTTFSILLPVVETANQDDASIVRSAMSDPGAQS
jgi:signal transduction histidine kinase